MVVDIAGDGVVVNALPDVDAIEVVGVVDVVFIVVDFATQLKLLLICCDVVFLSLIHI